MFAGLLTLSVCSARRHLLRADVSSQMIFLHVLLTFLQLRGEKYKHEYRLEKNKKSSSEVKIEFLTAVHHKFPFKLQFLHIFSDHMPSCKVPTWKTQYSLGEYSSYPLRSLKFLLIFLSAVADQNQLALFVILVGQPSLLIVKECT